MKMNKYVDQKWGKNISYGRDIITFHKRTEWIRRWNFLVRKNSFTNLLNYLRLQDSLSGQLQLPQQQSSYLLCIYLLVVK